MTTSPTPTVSPDLKQVLKRLPLSGMLPTLPGRIALAKQSHIEYTAFL